MLYCITSWYTHNADTSIVDCGSMWKAKLSVPHFVLLNCSTFNVQQFMFFWILLYDLLNHFSWTETTSHLTGAQYTIQVFFRCCASGNSKRPLSHWRWPSSKGLQMFALYVFYCFFSCLSILIYYGWKGHAIDKSRTSLQKYLIIRHIIIFGAYRHVWWSWLSGQCTLLVIERSKLVS